MNLCRLLPPHQCSLLPKLTHTPMRTFLWHWLKGRCPGSRQRQPCRHGKGILLAQWLAVNATLLTHLSRKYMTTTEAQEQQTRRSLKRLRPHCPFQQRPYRRKTHPMQQIRNPLQLRGRLPHLIPPRTLLSVTVPPQPPWQFPTAVPVVSRPSHRPPIFLPPLTIARPLQSVQSVAFHHPSSIRRARSSFHLRHT